MRVRRLTVGGMGIIGAVLLGAAAAWACVSGPAVTLSTVNAAPGQEVGVAGTNFRQADPVTVRWNALDGPILATLPEPDDRLIGGSFTVPQDAAPGNYVVIVSQSNDQGEMTQMPIRALLTVTPDGAAQPALGAPLSEAGTERTAGLVTEDESISAWALFLVGLGVAGLGMFVAGVAALLASRRSPALEPARVRR